MKLYTEDYLIEMSDVRGKYVKHPHQLPFSFYFSSGTNTKHSIRVKPVFNPEKLKASQTGTLKLCDDWKFIPGVNDKSVSRGLIDEMKSFFRKYIILFCAVWDEQLQDGVLRSYLEGQIKFKDVIEDLDFYEDYEEGLSDIETVEELEKFCREHSLVNLYGN